MLENAGATILIPRKGDTQIHEIIIDNDRSTPGSEYKEVGWRESLVGWGRKPDLGIFKLLIRMGENPFYARYLSMAERSHRGKGKESLISGFPEIPESGNTRSMPPINLFPNSTERGTVYHPSCRRETTIAVNQTIMGGVGLGSIWENFKFTAHEQAHERIVLTNQSNKSGKIITADDQDRWRHGEHRT